MTDFDEAAFVAAGLYDPELHASTGRRELLVWLTELDFTVDEMIEAEARLALGAAPWDQRLVPRPLHTAEQARRRSGLGPEVLDELSTAAGLAPLPDSPDGEVGYTEAEADALGAIGTLSSVFSEAESLAFVRVLGSALERVGEAAVSLFLTDVEGPHLAAGRSEYELARKVFESAELLDDFTPHLAPLLRRHVLQATNRTRETMIGEIERMQFRFAVGFVDLVGFTAMSSEMGVADLASFLRDFEGRAYDLATAQRARVVKLIGDEVMFVATDPNHACAAGQALIEGFTVDGVVPRGGVAYGDVLLRSGDYFGSVVNLAARLVDEAVPGELLVTEELAAASTNCVFEPAGRRQVKGFVDPITVHALGAGPP